MIEGKAQNTLLEAYKGVVHALVTAGLWDEIKAKSNEPNYRRAISALVNEWVMDGVDGGGRDPDDQVKPWVLFEQLVRNTGDDPNIAREIGFAVRNGVAALSDSEESFSPPRLSDYASILAQHPQLDWVAQEFVTTYADYLVESGGATLGHLPEFVSSLIDREDLVRCIHPHHLKAYVDYVRQDDSYEIQYFRRGIEGIQKSPYVNGILNDLNINWFLTSEESDLSKPLPKATLAVIAGERIRRDAQDDVLDAERAEQKIFFAIKDLGHHISVYTGDDYGDSYYAPSCVEALSTWSQDIKDQKNKKLIINLFRFVARAVAANLDDRTRFDCAPREMRDMVAFLVDNNLLGKMPAEVKAIASSVGIPAKQTPSRTEQSIKKTQPKTGKYVELLYVDAGRELCTREIALKKGKLAQDVALEEAQNPDNGIYAFREIQRKGGRKIESGATTYFGRPSLRIAYIASEAVTSLRKMAEEIPSDIQDICILSANHRTVISPLHPSDRVIDFKGNQTFPLPQAIAG